jgi:hypothetical protein
MHNDLGIRTATPWLWIPGSRFWRPGMTANKYVLAARFASEFCRPLRKKTKPFQTNLRSRMDKIMRREEGGGAPEGASNHSRATPPDVASRRCAGAAAGFCASPLALRRSTAALAAATERFDSVQAALHANGREQALPAPSFALKQSTLRAGRSTGGDDTRTARRRGYEPRPQEPHPLRFRDRLEKRPS